MEMTRIQRERDGRDEDIYKGSLLDGIEEAAEMQEMLLSPNGRRRDDRIGRGPDSAAETCRPRTAEARFRSGVVQI